MINKNSFFLGLKDIIHLIGKDKKKLPILFFFIIFSSIIDLLSIGLIFPYIGILIDPNQLINMNFFQSFLSKEMLDFNQLVFFLSVILGVLFTCKFLVNIFLYKYILTFAFNNALKLRFRLLKNYQNLNYINYLNYNSSHFLNTINVLVGQYQTVSQAFLTMLSELFIISCIIIFLAITTGKLFFALVAIILLFILIFDFVFKKKLFNLGLKSNFHQAEMLKNINEAIAGFKDLKILNRSDFFHKKFVENSSIFTRLKIFLTLINMVPRLALELILVLFVIVVILISNFYFDNLNFVLPILSMYAIAAMRILPGSNKLMTSLQHLRYGRAAIQTLKKDNSLSNLNIQVESSNNNTLDHDEVPKFNKIQFKNVSFKYPGREEYIIKNINLEIYPGKIYGIYGKSGRGKTTLANLFLGLLNPTEGKILFNENSFDHNNLLSNNFFAYLPQDIFLIDDTIRNNVALGLKEEEISEKNLLEALTKSHLIDVVKELPDKQNTIVGEKGIRLSGGQRQRVAIARAFYNNSQILVLDESTSSLDKNTQKEILAEIEKMKNDKTIIFISHDPDVFSICDEVIEI